MDLPSPVVEVLFLIQGSKTKDGLVIGVKEQLPKSFNDSGVIKNVQLFCFPNDSGSQQNERWKYHNFVLTNQFGARLFAHCLRFPVVGDKSSVGVLCALSRECYYLTMQHLLVHLWSTKKGATFDFKELLTPADDSRFVNELNRLVYCAVCPCSKDMQIRYVLQGHFPLANRFHSIQTVHYKQKGKTNSSISFLFGQPGQKATRLPSVDFKLSLLFSCLSVPNVILVWRSLLSESKIVLMSSTAGVLAHVTQALITLLWPFTWQHVFIPLLPDHMLDFLTAPTPFIMGMLRRDESEFDLDDDAMLVDLDRNTVKRGNQHLAAKLPPLLEVQLEEELYAIVRPEMAVAAAAVPPSMVLVMNDSEAATSAFYNQHPEGEYNRSIQMAFFTVWRRLFNGWNFGSIAEINQYITDWVPPQHQGFYQAFCATQSFDTFHRIWLTDLPGNETPSLPHTNSSSKTATSIGGRLARSTSFSAPTGMATSHPEIMRGKDSKVPIPIRAVPPNNLSLSTPTPPVSPGPSKSNYPHVVKLLVSMSPSEDLDSLYYKPTLVLDLPQSDFSVPSGNDGDQLGSTANDTVDNTPQKDEPKPTEPSPGTATEPVTATSTADSNPSTAPPSAASLFSFAECDEACKQLPRVYQEIADALAKQTVNYTAKRRDTPASDNNSPSFSTQRPSKKKTDERKRRSNLRASVQGVNINLLLVHFRLKLKQNVETLQALSEIYAVDERNVVLNNHELFERIFSDIHEQYKDTQLKQVLASIKQMPKPVSDRLMDYLDKEHAEIREKLQKRIEYEARLKVEQQRVKQFSQLVNRQHTEEQLRRSKLRSKDYSFIVQLELPKPTSVSPTNDPLAQVLSPSKFATDTGNQSGSSTTSGVNPPTTPATSLANSSFNPAATVEPQAFVEWALVSGLSMSQRAAENLYHSLNTKPGLVPLRMKKVYKFATTLQKCHSQLWQLSRELSNPEQIGASSLKNRVIDLDPILASLDFPSGNTNSGTGAEADIREFVLLHQSGVFYNNQRGHLFLTTVAIIFIPQKNNNKMSEIYIPLAEIHDVEKFNFKVVLPPGVPCIKLILVKEKQGVKQEEVFCLMTNRSFWYYCIKEMLSGYVISRDLSDDTFINESGLNIMLAQTVSELSKERAHLLFRHEDDIQGYSRIFKTIQEVGILNNGSKPWKPKEQRDPCEVVVELLLSALQLFFSFTQQQQQLRMQKQGKLLKSLPQITLPFKRELKLRDYLPSPKGSPRVTPSSSFSVPSSTGSADSTPRRGLVSSTSSASLMSPSSPSTPSQAASSPGISSASGATDSIADELPAYEGSGSFTIDFEKLRKSPEFEAFSEATAELQAVDLSPLSDTERMAFFVNVYNLMVIHGYIHVGFASSLLEWRYFSRFVCYTIGLFPYTLDCVHRILRGRNAIGTCVGDHIFSEGDPRASFLLERNDARVHFLLCLHNVSSPTIRTVFPHTLDRHLADAALEYCQKQVELDSNKVVLPMIFDWYQKDFENRPEDGTVKPSMVGKGGNGVATGTTTDATPEGTDNKQTPFKPAVTSTPPQSPTRSLKIGGARNAMMGLGCIQWLSDDQKKKIAEMVGDEGIAPEIAYHYDWTPHPTPPI